MRWFLSCKWCTLMKRSFDTEKTSGREWCTEIPLTAPEKPLYTLMGVCAVAFLKSKRAIRPWFVPTTSFLEWSLKFGKKVTYTNRYEFVIKVWKESYMHQSLRVCYGVINVQKEKSGYICNNLCAKEATCTIRQLVFILK